MGNNIQRCQPSLSRDSYFPGNPLQGNVNVVATDNVEYYGIRVEIIGTLWMKWESSTGKSRTTHYSTNIFSKTVITVAGDSEQTAQKKKTVHSLEKGEHNYPFSTILSPATLPSDSCTAATHTPYPSYCVQRTVSKSSTRHPQYGTRPHRKTRPRKIHRLIRMARAGAVRLRPIERSWPRHRRHRRWPLSETAAPSSHRRASET